MVTVTDDSVVGLVVVVTRVQLKNSVSVVLDVEVETRVFVEVKLLTEVVVIVFPGHGVKVMTTSLVQTVGPQSLLEVVVA